MIYVLPEANEYNVYSIKNICYVNNKYLIQSLIYYSKDFYIY